MIGCTGNLSPNIRGPWLMPWSLSGRSLRTASRKVPRLNAFEVAKVIVCVALLTVTCDVGSRQIVASLGWPPLCRSPHQRVSALCQPRCIPAASLK